MSAREFSSCDYCGSPLGCAVDCPNAPWNHDRGRTTPIAYLTRLVRWCRGQSDRALGLPLGFTLSELRWLR